MGKLGLFARVGGWVRGGRHRAVPTDPDGGDELPTTEADRDSSPTAQGGDSADATAAERITTTMSRRSRREVSLSKLQEGYDRVLDLMDRIQSHMQTQETRTGEIASALSQLSRSLADVPSVDQQQVQLLSTIAAQLETTTVRTQQLSDAIGELPRVVRGQTDALSGIQRQLEMSAESDVHLTGTLQSFGRSVDRLGQSTETQATALQELNAAGEAHQRRLDEILQRQTRQFTWLVIITAVLAGAAIVAGTLAVVLQLRG